MKFAAGASSMGLSRPGGRSARVRAEVLAAVREELTANGYDGLSIDAVARRSGIHRATVYRRWKDVGGLLADSVEEAREDGWQPPDTGSLVRDLVVLNREVHAAFTVEPSISAALVAASFRSPPAAAALRAFWADRYAQCLPVVERAVARTEVPIGTDPMRLLVAATAPVYQRLILFRDSPSLDDVDRYAREAAEAGRAGVYTDGVTGGSTDG